MRRLTEEICQLMRSCGQILLSADRDSIRIDQKEGKGNFVTEYDRRIQEMLRRCLLALVPEAGFIGEEGEQTSFSDKGKYFIVDPLDGTANFIRDYRMSCISVALAEEGEITLGAVYNPYLREMFAAEKGKGAYCNRKKLQVSSLPLSEGLVIFGTSPYYEELHRKTFELAYGYSRIAADVRRSGSAALDLCSVAAGRAERFFELKLSPWDYAAGSLLVTEAGGSISDWEGSPLRFDRPCSVLAKNRADASEPLAPESFLR